jgi:hypothetical protein
MADPNEAIAQQPEEELGGGPQAPGAPGAIPGQQGTDADLGAAAQAAAFKPTQFIARTVRTLVIAPPSSGGPGGAPLTAEQRGEQYEGLVTGLLDAIGFDQNVLAIMERGGIGANLSPGVVIGIGLAVIVGAAFMFRAPKAPKPVPVAHFVRPASTAAGPQPAGATI